MSVAIIPICAYSLFLTVVLRLSSHSIKLTLLHGAIQQILVYLQSCASIIPHYRIFSSPQNESSYSSQLPFPTLLSSWQSLMYVLYIWISLFWTVGINGIIQHVCIIHLYSALPDVTNKLFSFSSTMN